jgi:CHAT domain-containing protein/tetratricopeptide (TPR) repeat protein
MQNGRTKKRAARASRLMALALCLLVAVVPAWAQPDALEESQRLISESVRLFREGKYREAVPMAERAVTLREKLLGPDHPLVANSLNNLAKLYEELGDAERAVPLYDRAIKSYEKTLGAEHMALAAPLHNLGELYSAIGEYERGEPLFLRAIAIVTKALGAEHPHAATSANSLALLYRLTGRYDKAEEYFRRALAIREKVLGPESGEAAESLGGLALLARVRGDYAGSDALFRRAIAALEKSIGPEHPRTAAYLNSYAILLVAKADYAQAETVYQRVLAVREKTYGPEHRTVAETLNNIGLLYKVRGDDAQAERLFLRALAIHEKVYGPGTGTAADFLNNLAELYRTRGDYAQAEGFYRRALAAYEKAHGPEHPALAAALNNFALFYSGQGDLARAEPLIRRAIEIGEKTLGPEHPQVFAASDSLGHLYKQRGEYERAEPLYRRALAAAEKVYGPEHPYIATSLSDFAALFEAKGDVASAVEMMERAEETHERVVRRVLFSGSERQKMLYLDKLMGTTYGVVSLHLRSAPTEARAARLALTTVLRRKGRALDAMAEQVAALRRRLDAQDRELLDRLADAQSRLSALVLGGGGARSEIARLEAEIERVQDAVARRSAEFRVAARPVTLEQVREALPAGAALVEFVSYAPYDPHYKIAAEKFGPERYAVYVLKKEGEPLWADLGEGAATNVAVWRLRAALKDPRRTDVKELARALDERIMRPVRKLLGETRRVFVSPDGSLNLVPLAALVDERGKYLVEDYSLTYLTSGRDLLRLSETNENRQPPLVVADPLFGGEAATPDATAPRATGQATSTQATERASAPEASAESGGARRSVDMAAIRFDRLPGTAAEAKALATAIPGVKVLTEAQATEGALKQVSGPRVLHIATHGFFLPDRPVEPAAYDTTRGIGLVTGEAAPPARAENPLLRSGLALEGANRRRSGAAEDGILTALEAAGLDLWGTKLVVLSACETGVGEVKNGEGVYGLRRALVLAGSESQVMSLWQVSDEATRDLMVGYYSRLGAGEGRTEALRQVQLGMLRGPAAVASDTGGEGDRESQQQQRGLGEQVQKAAGAADYSHPFYWAAFIQSGDWRPMSAPLGAARPAH